MEYQRLLDAAYWKIINDPVYKGLSEKTKQHRLPSVRVKRSNKSTVSSYWVNPNDDRPSGDGGPYLTPTIHNMKGRRTMTIPDWVWPIATVLIVAAALFFGRRDMHEKGRDERIRETANLNTKIDIVVSKTDTIDKRIETGLSGIETRLTCHLYQTGSTSNLAGPCGGINEIRASQNRQIREMKEAQNMTWETIWQWFHSPVVMIQIISVVAAAIVSFVPSITTKIKIVVDAIVAIYSVLSGLNNPADKANF